MNINDLDLAKLSKLTSDYIDNVKCLECCKFYIAPTTAICGHTLCHTCWRWRRSCPSCSISLDRKALKLNLPLQNLTNHTQSLGEAFQKLFHINLDEFGLDAPGDIQLSKDPDINVKEWLTSSQNHFSAPLHNSEAFSQESQLPHNPIEISASNIIIHTEEKKSVSPSKVTKVVHVPQPQDDWDKIESMPDIENIPKSNSNIVGPMDIEPFFVDDSKYTTDNPRRSSRKRDVKQDDSHQKMQDLSPHKHNSRDSSCDNDNKTLKSKQTWNNVKRMRKEFSKLNKKNRNKLNVSIEMVKKTQNVKPMSNTPLVDTPPIVNIDENTPANFDKWTENEIINNNANNIDEKIKVISTNKIKEPTTTNDHDSIKFTDDQNSMSVFNQNNNNAVKNSKVKDIITSSETSENIDKSQHSLNRVTKLPFIKKSALCPKNIIVDNVSYNPKHRTIPVNSVSAEDIEISIKIGDTITNILIKKKNEVQVKIKTDREVQTSLGPDTLVQNETTKNVTNNHNIAINVENKNINVESRGNIDKSIITQVTSHKIEKSISGKKNTASADTATAPQFEITESVEKELSNIMEYETAEGKENSCKDKNASVAAVQPSKSLQVQENENVENLEDLNDLDIFNSGSVKEANVHLLKEHAPSEILMPTVCSKGKTQRNVEKRNREHSDNENLPENKKAKVASQPKDKSVLLDSEPNYDVIMGQVFANIDADIEHIRKSQNPQHIEPTAEQMDEDLSKSKDLSQAQKTTIIKTVDQPNITTNTLENFNARHSENVFSILEKEDENIEFIDNAKLPQQVEEFLTPVLCHNLDSSQESLKSVHKTNKSNRKTQDYDDSDRSVVEETPQKDISIPKLKRVSTSNLSQIGLSETKKIPSKISGQSLKSIINLTDTVTESNKSSRDVTVVETNCKRLTLETPLTITKFNDHIVHKSTPVARKSLNFDNNHENDDDPEQTLCPTSDIIAKTTQEKEFMSKAFEKTPSTPTARPLMARNMSKANKRYCLAGSCLTLIEITYVKTLCAERKWSYVEKYTKDITHLVVGVDEEKKSQRSVKYMCALAASKWIVSFDWINSCLRSKDIPDEEYFEALDSTGEPGPRRSRVAKKKLFQGIKFYCMPPFSVLDVNTLKNMLVAAGGQVVNEMKEVRVSKDSAAPALLLAEPEHTQEDRFIYLAMEQSIVPVNYEWVLNCLGSYSLGSIQELLLCPSSLLPAATAKWPEVLVAQDYD